MPFHGLVRDSAFGVDEVTSDRVTLLRTSCREWRRDCYPFDFALRLTYALEGGALHLTVTLSNHEDQPMPHAFGWHPYFVTTDKARARLKPNMARCERWDEEGKVATPTADIDLNHPADYVFSSRDGNEAEIISPTDGYAARIRSNDAFRALVVCSKFPGTTCVEPWMGLPNAANTRENLQFVAPKGEARYDCEIRPYHFV
jgi:aldose 1-epimerase